MSAETETKEQRCETPRLPAIKHPNLQQSHTYNRKQNAVNSLVRVCKHQTRDLLCQESLETCCQVKIKHRTPLALSIFLSRTHTHFISTFNSHVKHNREKLFVAQRNIRHQTSGITDWASHTQLQINRTRRRTRKVFNPSKCISALQINIRHLILNVTDPQK